MTSLSVIIPATDGPATLGACVDAIAATGADPEIIVVTEAPGHGASAARNRGVEDAHGDVIVFVDADVAVHPDALRRIRDAFEADPSLTAIFGAYDAAPSAPGTVSRFRNLLHHHVHHQGAGEARTFWTGLGAMRRAAFEEVGGFDPAVHGIEDVELGARLIDAGGRIRLDPAVAGTHLKRWTLWSMVRTDLLMRGVPWVRMMLRRRRVTGTLNLGARHRASALASLALAGAILTRRPGLAAAGLGVLVVANRDFYALLVRRLGPARAPAGVALHVVHHLTAVAAVPVGVALHLAKRG